jgi:glycosyltransferase A (GT-A) superfamily protein (DUF2064 family)
MNKNVLIAANESAHTKGLLHGLKGMGIRAHLLSTARSTMAFLQDRCPAVMGQAIRGLWQLDGIRDPALCA